MENIDITVIIPVFNAALLLDRCLDSVFNQKTTSTLELILIDDGSRDNSVELIKKRPEKNIVLIQQENSGPATARNKGIELAKGEYIAFLDADDYWMPDFLKETTHFLQKHTEAVAVSVGQIHKTFTTKDVITPSFLIEENRSEQKAQLLSDFFDFWGTYKHVCTGSVLMKTEIAKLTGGQRSDLRITEDLEYWAYLSTFGQWGFIPEILFVSDGNDVTKNTGWLEKMQQRWNNAPTVEEWEKRIVHRLSEPHSVGYKKARGVIARNLCYSQILSGRFELSHTQVLKYGIDFPKDKIALLMKFASRNRLFWRIVCRILVYRETQRK